MIPPCRNRFRDHRPDALHRFEPPALLHQHRSRVASQLHQQAIERDRADIRQRVEDEKRLPFG